MLNTIFMLILILTGLSMQYSGTDASIIPFSVAVRMHNISGIILSASYLLFVIGNFFSGNGQHYRIQWQGLKKRLVIQLRYYMFGYLRKQNHPYPVSQERKFNPLQAFTYALIMYIALPLVVISGWGLLFPETILDRVFGVSGMVLTDLLHVIMGFLLSVFMIIHIYTITLGTHPLRNFRSIITGWHHTEDTKS